MKKREFTARHMAFCVGGFFGTIITVNMVLAYFANSTWSGLIAKNGYVTSQAYNGVLETARKQNSLGWKSKLAINQGRIDFDISDRDGNRIYGLVVRAKITRPTHENEDKTVTFSPGVDGNYAASPALADGQWIVDLVAENSAGLRYRQVFRLVIDANKKS